MASPPKASSKSDEPFYACLTVEQRIGNLKGTYKIEPEPEPEAEPNPRRKRSIPFPDPDLIRWCQTYMRRMSSSRTAREIVNYWYSTWRGHDGGPKPRNRAEKAACVDRVTKWLERHEKAGRLKMVERRASFGSSNKRTYAAKSYEPIEGADWRRPRKPRED